MSVQEVEIATLEREVMHSTRAPFQPTATLARTQLTALSCPIGCYQVQKLGPVPDSEKITGVIRWREWSL